MQILITKDDLPLVREILSREIFNHITITQCEQAISNSKFYIVYLENSTNDDLVTMGELLGIKKAEKLTVEAMLDMANAIKIHSVNSLN